MDEQGELLARLATRADRLGQPEAARVLRLPNASRAELRAASNALRGDACASAAVGLVAVGAVELAEGVLAAERRRWGVAA